MKKSILIIAGIFVASISLLANGSNTVSVKVKNLENTKGKVSVSLFDMESKWLQDGRIESVVPISTTEVLVTFVNVPTGVYAVSVIHDENANGELDTALFGIPTEAYGFSNDAKGNFGPATFQDSSFEVQGDLTIQITLD